MPLKKQARDQVAAEASARDFGDGTPSAELHAVTVRLTERQYRRVQAMAAESGISLAAQLRVLLTRALE